VRRLAVFVIGALFGAGLLFGGQMLLAAADSSGEDLELATGKDWVASQDVEKAAYLVGIGNLMNVEFAFQMECRQPPEDDQTIIQAMHRALDDVSLNEVTRTLDTYFEKNPDKRSLPVLVVIWNELVKPKLEKKK
jgi:hypothetical protein